MVEFNCEGSVCRLTGRLSQGDVVKLWGKRKRLLSDKIEVIELSALTYSDSAGIAFILELIALAKRERREITLSAASSQLSKLIALYDLEHFFDEEVKQGK
ncbi:putative NTP binding protein (contains STAS domain) [Shewanella psychrophila]|uniref:Putative NTP binding protein (Contains STAS domain) n=1 Tax=Shewanella psychrophila TaxID=225848 RepID=A0A1S6HXG1_9GAMM|nr:STAS domain-containing protein [Shewanella psychrophila]AQS40266.1 putative NTP binding protein (contains STAS domain) [Shewanella psychrophila]